MGCGRYKACESESKKLKEPSLFTEKVLNSCNNYASLNRGSFPKGRGSPPTTFLTE